MNSAQIKSVIFSAALILVMVSLLTVPAFAGKLSIMNTDQNNPYLVRYEDLTFGSTSHQVMCVSPGESTFVDRLINAYTWIAVVRSKCPCSSFGTAGHWGECYGEDVVEYTVSGTPTAFRKFVVTIADGPTAIIAEQK